MLLEFRSASWGLIREASNNKIYEKQIDSVIKVNM